MNETIITPDIARRERPRRTERPRPSFENDRALSAIRQPSVRDAALRVASKWCNVRGEALDREEFLSELAVVAGAVSAGPGGALPKPTTTASAILRRRILDQLRTELVDGWAMDPGTCAAEIVPVLESLERVRVALEPDWDPCFISNFSAQSGLDLVVDVAHDLRSPLTSILFLSETLRKGQSGEINEIQKRQLGIIYSAALGLISMVSDMIELARGGDQLADAEPSPFSVTEVLQSVQDIVQPLADEKGLALRLAPPARDQRLGYPVALSRVLLNLTTNALKFTDEGMVEIVAQARGLSHVEFSVRDTGCGIDPEVLPTLFQPFQRSRTRKDYHFSGSGLGLAISRKLVEAMGASLELETRPQWGTRFHFLLHLPPASPF